MENKGMVKVTMIHGLAGCTKRQIATATALGLSRPNDERVLPNNPATIGACKKLEHLVKVEFLNTPAVKENPANAPIKKATPQKITPQKGGAK
jgi:ribosomal protein L30